MYDKKGSQIDIAVLDFSKAFDTVPHDGLLDKYTQASYSRPELELERARENQLYVIVMPIVCK